MTDNLEKPAGSGGDSRAEKIRKELEEIYKAKEEYLEEIHRRGGEPTAEDLERLRIYDELRDELGLRPADIGLLGPCRRWRRLAA